jgi:hypothetical protein
MRWSVRVDRGLAAAIALGLVLSAMGAPARLNGQSSSTAIAGSVPVTDLGTHTEPAIASLPAAGGTLVDSVFQTPLIRLTDAADGSDCRVEYSYWPTFNVNSTRVKALCVISGVNRTKIWTFDPVSFTRGTASLMPQVLQSSDPIWSASDPNIVFGHSQTHLLLAYNVATQATTTIKDFTSIVPSGGQLQQMSMASNDDLFAFHATN